MRKFWAKSLAAQIIWFMLPIMLLAQSIGFFVTADERAQALREIALEEFIVRSTTAVQMIDSMPDGYRDAVLNAMGTNYSRFWLSADVPEKLDVWSREAWQRLQIPLTNGGKERGVADHDPDGSWGTMNRDDTQWGITDNSALQSTFSDPDARWYPIELNAPSGATSAQFVQLDDNYGSGLVAKLPNGLWLNAAYAKPHKSFIWLTPTTVSLAITAIVLSVLAVLVARRIAGPMRRLTLAAEAIGRGEQNVEIPEEGPDDMRRTAVAFNQMQGRLSRFLADRTAMLAAIGHDLRTPITTMRLHTEFIADADTRMRLLDTVNEMQAITDATLEFTQDQSIHEPTRSVDIAALVESICNDLSDLGRDVSFTESEIIPYRCRPAALRRAVRNLIENAIRYGGRARVSVVPTSGGLDIVVDDDGPGIPDDEIERVFLPFVRLEKSRNANSGGIGLGLSIARTITRSHGGDVLLSNRTRGLRAMVRLPKIPDALMQSETAQAA